MCYVAADFSIINEDERFLVTNPFFSDYGFIFIFVLCTVLLHPIFLLVIVSFDPTSYTVTEGIDGTAELMLVRSGNLNEGVAVSVTTMSGTAIGMAEWNIYLY